MKARKKEAFAFWLLALTLADKLLCPAAETLLLLHVSNVERRPVALQESPGSPAPYWDYQDNYQILDLSVRRQPLLD